MNNMGNLEPKPKDQGQAGCSLSEESAQARTIIAADLRTVTLLRVLSETSLNHSQDTATCV